MRLSEWNISNDGYARNSFALKNETYFSRAYIWAFSGEYWPLMTLYALYSEFGLTSISINYFKAQLIVPIEERRNKNNPHFSASIWSKISIFYLLISIRGVTYDLVVALNLLLSVQFNSRLALHVFLFNLWLFFRICVQEVAYNDAAYFTTRLQIREFNVNKWQMAKKKSDNLLNISPL